MWLCQLFWLQNQLDAEMIQKYSQCDVHSDQTGAIAAVSAAKVT